MRYENAAIDCNAEGSSSHLEKFFIHTIGFVLNLMQRLSGSNSIR